MTFEEFCEEVGRARERYPSWRAGQAWFNELHRLRRDLADRIDGTSLDPFHLDPKDRKGLLHFINWLRYHWDERTEA